MDPVKQAQFHDVVLSELPAAYSLARWLTGNAADAEDVVQDALLRGFQYFDGFRGGSPRAWLLRIVRNVAMTWLSTNRHAGRVSLDQVPGVAGDELVATGSLGEDPAEAAARARELTLLRGAIAALPVDQREVVILRDVEGLSYREVADVLELPLGTMMSRLARARHELEQQLRPVGGQLP